MENLRAIIVLAFLIIMILTIPVVGWLIWTKDAPWNATSWKKVYKKLELANVQPGETVYDLGSGDGRVLISAARHFDAKGVGIEIDPARYAMTRLIIRLLGLHNQIDMIRGDLFEQDLSKADVITFYLLPNTNERLVEILWNDLSKGTRIVSHRFKLPGWKHVRYLKEENLYLYVVDEAYRE